jgi:VWFA-related protein
MAGLAAQQQQPPPVTFKTEVDYVDVDATVTDEGGNPVRDLTAADFELYEDGVRQTIDMFSYVDLSVAPRERLAFGGRAVVADVRTNQESLAGRLYVIVLDDLNTSFFRTTTVRHTARQFVERHMGANDTAAVVYTSGRADGAQEFTSDPALLVAAIDKFVGGKLRSAALDRIDAFFNVQERRALDAAGRGASSGPPMGNTGSLSAGASTDPNINPYTRGDGYPDRTYDSEDMERGFRALRVLGELKGLADFMANVHGRRKALLLFSEGIDYPMDDIFGAHEASQVIKATEDAIAAAARGNVSIFGIDPRGLVGMSADAMSLASSPGTVDDPAAAATNMAGFNAEMRLSQDSLRTLSEETGGFASVNANDPSPAFDSIVRANSRYYVLAYYPPPHPRDGAFHRIQVRVTRPGVRVMARKGYVSGKGSAAGNTQSTRRSPAGADRTTSELRAVLDSPMQQDGVAMLVQAAPFNASAKDHSVALTIEIACGPFRFERRSDGSVYEDRVELSYFSMNEQGKPLGGEHRELQLSLRPETFERARQAGVRINERLTLAPGRYQLRIGVRERGAGALGTVFYDLEVPDFRREPLTVSGLLVSAATSPIVPTLIPDGKVTEDMLMGPATSRRTFARADELALYAEVYDNVRGAAHTLETAARVTGEDGRDVFTSREAHQQSPRSAGDGPVTYAIAKRIPLKDIPPGRYLVQVSARIDSGREPHVATRETLITIVP